MQSYLNLLRHIIENGEGHQDRTGVGTKSVFGYQLRHDLRDGFPLLTTKKMFVRGIFVELEWFLKGMTDNQWLNDRGIHIWDEWATKEQCAKFGREEGDLGRVYGEVWNHFGSDNNVVRVESKTPGPRCEVDPQKETYCADNPSTYAIGLLEQGWEGHNGRLIRLSSGMWKAARNDVPDNKVADDFSPTRSGVGYLGVISISDKSAPWYSVIQKCWGHMLERCYDPQCKEYEFYGAKGITVCKRWHNFANFCQDVTVLPNWPMKKADLLGYQLDKDHFRSDIYSPDTCIWLKKSRNGSLYPRSVSFIATSPDGQIYKHLNQTEFAIEHDLERSKISAVLRGERHSHKGWKFARLPYDLRYSTTVNQIKNLVNDLISNPGSRRHIVTAWDPTTCTQVSLPPCHTLFQCKISGEFLDLQLYQRSADSFLGVPFNIASYAALTHILAKLAKKVPRYFVHTFGDLHIYNNHIDQVSLQLSREPYYLPRLEVSDSLTNINDFNHDMLKVVDYKCHPAIKAPVAV